MHNFFSIESGIERNVLSFLIPYLSITILTFIVVRYKKFLREWKFERHIRLCFIFFMIILELSFYIWTFVNVADYSFKSYFIEYRMIPLHVCAIALWLIIIVGFTKNEKLFRFTFFIAIIGPLFTIIGGKLTFSYDRFRYWHFYQEHINTFTLALYMKFVHKLKIYKGDWISALLILTILATFVALPLNVSLGTNFMYVYNYDNSPLTVFNNRVVAYLALLFLTTITFKILDLLFSKKKVLRN